ncbi:hypothetical protein Ciccas_008256 [Cichlidogyrus casuarinus]|uniref:Uncharacterized protein n=1 Tax=Cichlidogyrus casuarinus TaxID=1844966 RepID=A0ABD2Q0G8_9PLAT
MFPDECKEEITFLNSSENSEPICNHLTSFLESYSLLVVEGALEPVLVATLVVVLSKSTPFDSKYNLLLSLESYLAQLTADSIEYKIKHKLSEDRLKLRHFIEAGDTTKALMEGMRLVGECAHMKNQFRIEDLSYLISILTNLFPMCEAVTWPNYLKHEFRPSFWLIDDSLWALALALSIATDPIDVNNHLMFVISVKIPNEALCAKLIFCTAVLVISENVEIMSKLCVIKVAIDVLRKWLPEGESENLLETFNEKKMRIEKKFNNSFYSGMKEYNNCAANLKRPYKKFDHNLMAHCIAGLLILEPVISYLSSQNLQEPKNIKTIWKMEGGSYTITENSEYKQTRKSLEDYTDTGLFQLLKLYFGHWDVWLDLMLLASENLSESNLNSAMERYQPHLTSLDMSYSCLLFTFVLKNQRDPEACRDVLQRFSKKGLHLMFEQIKKNRSQMIEYNLLMLNKQRCQLISVAIGIGLVLVCWEMVLHYTVISEDLQKLSTELSWSVYLLHAIECTAKIWDTCPKAQCGLQCSLSVAADNIWKLVRKSLYRYEYMCHELVDLAMNCRIRTLGEAIKEFLAKPETAFDLLPIFSFILFAIVIHERSMKKDGYRLIKLSVRIIRPKIPQPQGTILTKFDTAVKKIKKNMEESNFHEASCIFTEINNYSKKHNTEAANGCISKIFLFGHLMMISALYPWDYL